MENKIIMIGVDMLCPHPQNPRKNVGDVSELAESIKKSGIMQNLTVIPHIDGKDGYTVVIGHRRLAAAKNAGLAELPCIIKEMNSAEQLATMLAENVQRNDLTPLEQAEGIQMMFDIGESVSDVVDKTGLSESTVRRRAKMLEMDIKALRESESKGATLADYEKLGQIEDIGRRNEVLKSIGTNNFDYNIRTALDKQKREKNRNNIHGILETFAKKVDGYPSNSSYVAGYNHSLDEVSVSIPEDSETEKYVYTSNDYNTTLYKIKTEKEDEATARAKQKEKEKMEKELNRVNKVCELAERAYNLRREFIDKFTPTVKHGVKIRKFLWNMLVFPSKYVSERDIDEVCGTSFVSAGTYEEKSAIADEYFENNSEKAMVQMAYILSDDSKNAYVYRWNGTWEESAITDKLYECLESLGYQMSDEEKALQDGTHELFIREN